MTFLAELQELVECQSPTEDLAACTRVIELASELVSRNLSTPAKVMTENGRPVLWWGSENPKVVLLTHLDTVWPTDSFLPLWKVDGDKIFGPGTFDMKAGFLQALHALKNIPGAEKSVALIATTDEEVGSQTSRALIERVSKVAEAVLVFEASLDGKVKTGRKGTSMYQVKVHGRASHAGLDPEKGINATVEISAQILKFAALENIEFGTTVVPTMLKGGTTANTVPAEASVEIDARSFSQSDLERVDKVIRSLIAITPGAKIEVTGGLNRPVLEPASCKELYEIAERVAKEIGMAPLGCAEVGGASDGNFAAAAGARVLDGLGAVGGGAHAANEWASVSAIEERKNFLHAFIKELLK